MRNESLPYGDEGEIIRAKNAIVPKSRGDIETKKLAPIHGKVFPTDPVSNFFAHHPILMFVVGIVLLVVLAIMSLVVTTHTDRGISSFSIKNDDSARALAVLNRVQERWRAAIESTENGIFGKWVGNRAQVQYRIFVNYQANPNKIIRLASSADVMEAAQNALEMSNLFRMNSLEYMGRIEERISKLPHFSDLCWMFPSEPQRDRSPHCTPANSLMTYFRLGEIDNTTDPPLWPFDGVSGVIQQPIDRVVDRILLNPRYRWFVDQHAFTNESKHRRTSLLRSQFTIGAAPENSSDYSANVDEFVLRFIELLEHPAWHPFIDVTFGGDRVQETLVMRALRRDLPIILSVLPAAWLALWYHFHSLILAFIAVGQIGFTYPAALFLFVAISGVKEVSLLISLAYYAILLMAIRQMMIYFDTFRHSGFMATSGRKSTLTVEQRTAFCTRKAGLGISISSCVVLSAFVSTTVLSPIPAISSFSGFICSLVIVNWIWMMFFFPNAVLLHHFYISGRRRVMQKQRDIFLARGGRKRQGMFVKFLQNLDEVQVAHGIPSFDDQLNFMISATAMEMAQKAPSAEVQFRLLEAPTSRPQRFPIGRSMRGEETRQSFVEQFPERVNFHKRRGSECESPIEVMTLPPADPNHAINIRDVIRISNYNCDEMLGFDDSNLRRKLVESGNSSAAEFRREQLISLASDIGLQPLGALGKGKIPIVARVAIYMNFGGARTVASSSSMLHFHSNRHDAWLSRRVAFDKSECGTTVPRPGDESLQPPPTANVDQDNPGLCERISRWCNWRGGPVKRRWCCGFLGPRVNETPTQHDMRILSKRVKREGFSKPELFFFNTWAPAIHRTRYVHLVNSALLLAAAITLTCLLKAASEPPKILGRDNPSEAFDLVTAQFGEMGHCDFCSAYFRPLDHFPVMSLESIRACESIYPSPMMNARVDPCGVCEGNSTCLDCAGIPFGNAAFDNCFQCLTPSDFRWDSCKRCDSTSTSLECTPCFLNNNAGLGWNGRSCELYCVPEVNCDPSRGVCNKITGHCDCHEDFSRGFMADDPMRANSSIPPGQRVYCTMCVSGFFGSKCTLECAPFDGNECQCSNGRCTGCQPGYVSQNCNFLLKDVCNHGSWESGGEICTCDRGWGGSSCAVSTSCQSRGVTYNETHYPPGVSGCVCNGQWDGASCEYCRCFNGGTCLLNGTCRCYPPWTGVDCNTCDPACFNNGRCPRPWEPAMYDPAECRGLFCSSFELRAGKASTSECHRCDIPQGICYSVTPEICADDESRDWDSNCEQCMYDPFVDQMVLRTGWQKKPKAENIQCNCRGVFAGIVCDICPSPHHDVVCTPEGVLVGCDQMPADDNGHYKVYDVCGQCGGSDECIGCDGIPGSSKVLDRCGVCGGFNECPVPGSNSIVIPTASITLLWGVKINGAPDNFSIENPVVQNYLMTVCDRMLTSMMIKSGQSLCVWKDFAKWAATQGIFFPYESFKIHELLNQFLMETGRFTEVGFRRTVRGPVVSWMAFTFRSIVPEYGTTGVLQRHYDQWIRALDKINNLENGAMPRPLMASSAWVRLFTQKAAVRATVLTSCISVIVFFLVTLSTSCSIVITAIASAVLISSVSMVLGMFCIVGWELGPIEQIVMAFLPGVLAEHVVHMVEGYLIYLHETQSHLFARATTTLAAVRGMMERTGISLVTSGLVMLLCSIILTVAAHLYVFRRVGALMALIVVVTIFHVMVVMPSMLSAFGPVTTSRTARKMLYYAAFGFFPAVGAFLALYFAVVRSI